jgi:hypothetical protein
MGRDPRVHREVLHDITAWARTRRLVVRDFMPSPIRGTDGNVEFFLYLVPYGTPEQAIEALIERCLAAYDAGSTMQSDEVCCPPCCTMSPTAYRAVKDNIGLLHCQSFYHFFAEDRNIHGALS